MMDESKSDKDKFMEKAMAACIVGYLSSYNPKPGAVRRPLTMDQMRDEVLSDMTFIFECNKTMRMKNRLTRLMDSPRVRFNHKEYLARLQKRIKESLAAIVDDRVMVRQDDERFNEQLMMLRGKVKVSPEYKDALNKHPIFLANKFIDKMTVEQKRLPPVVHGAYLISPKIRKEHKPKTLAAARRSFQNLMAKEEEERRREKEGQKLNAILLAAERASAWEKMVREGGQYSKDLWFQAPMVSRLKKTTQMEHMYHLGDLSIEMTEYKKGARKWKKKEEVVAVAPPVPQEEPEEVQASQPPYSSPPEPSTASESSEDPSQSPPQEPSLQEEPPA